MAQGYVFIKATTSNAKIPIKDAYVALTRKNGDREELLGFSQTNVNGRSETFTLETPEKEASLQESDSGIDPFATCDITVYRDEYYRVEIKDAQIFPGIVTIQEVNMIPTLENGDSNDSAENFVVTPQNL